MASSPSEASLEAQNTSVASVTSIRHEESRPEASGDSPCSDIEDLNPARGMWFKIRDLLVTRQPLLAQQYPQHGQGSTGDLPAPASASNILNTIMEDYTGNSEPSGPPISDKLVDIHQA